MPNYERPQETYYCQCAGCPNGMGSVFYAAPKEWFTARGLSTPKSCPRCRKWIDEEASACISYCDCGGSIRSPKLFVISYYKKVGPWIPPTQCSDCRRGVGAPRGAGKLPSRKATVKKEEERRLTFCDIAQGIEVEARVVSDDCSDYQNKVAAPDNTKETRQVHIAHHMPGSPHSLVGHNPFGESKSPTAMVDPDVNDEQELLTAVSATFSVADSATMREYREGNNIVRLTLLDDSRIEKTVIRPHPNQTDCLVVVTTYDNLEVAELIEKYGRKSS